MLYYPETAHITINLRVFSTLILPQMSSIDAKQGGRRPTSEIRQLIPTPYQIRQVRGGGDVWTLLHREQFLPNPPLHVTPNGEMATRSGRAAIIPSLIVNALFHLLLFVWRLAVNKVP